MLAGRRRRCSNSCECGPSGEKAVRGASHSESQKHQDVAQASLTNSSSTRCSWKMAERQPEPWASCKKNKTTKKKANTWQVGLRPMPASRGSHCFKCFSPPPQFDEEQRGGTRLQRRRPRGEPGPFRLWRDGLLPARLSARTRAGHETHRAPRRPGWEPEPQWARLSVCTFLAGSSTFKITYFSPINHMRTVLRFISRLKWQAGPSPFGANYFSANRI